MPGKYGYDSCRVAEPASLGEAPVTQGSGQLDVQLEDTAGVFAKNLGSDGILEGSLLEVAQPTVEG